MDSERNNKSQIENAERLKEIPKWTHKYAQNRTLTTFVLIVIIMLSGAGISLPLAFAVAAFIKGKMILAGVGIAMFVAVLAFLFLFVSRVGGKNRGLLDRWIDQWIYGREGIASMTMPKLTKKMKWLDFVVGTLVSICVIGNTYLSMEGYISFKYLQPISALYIVPFFVFQFYFLQRPTVGPLVLICPILYTVHAILIVADVPIFFTGNLGCLNVAFPLFGYTFLAYMIGHLYSRYALKKLKTAAHLRENNNG